MVTRTEVVALNARDLAEIDDVRRRAGDYFLEVGDPPPTPASFQADLDDLPDGFGRSNELVFRAYRRGVAAGYAEVLRGFARPNQWMIGILLVDATLRGRGVGGSVVEAIALAATDAGARSLAAGVIATRERSLAFWRRKGFTKEVLRRPVTIAGLNTQVARLERELA